MATWKLTNSRKNNKSAVIYDVLRDDVLKGSGIMYLDAYAFIFREARPSDWIVETNNPSWPGDTVANLRLFMNLDK